MREPFKLDLVKLQEYRRLAEDLNRHVLGPYKRENLGEMVEAHIQFQKYATPDMILGMILALTEWQPMESAPRCGRDVLLLCENHGQIQGRFSQGEWSETMNGREYSGSVWILGDDIDQVEVEEPIRGEPESTWCDGSIKAWKELLYVDPRLLNGEAL